MKATVYFLFLPKSQLISRIDSKNYLGLNEFLSPILWTGDLPSRHDLKIADQDSVLKILFLDTVRRERNDTNSFAEVFFDLNLTIEYFDSLWSLQRIETDMYVDFALDDAVNTKTINGFINTGSKAVDVWFAAYSEKRSIDNL